MYRFVHLWVEAPGLGLANYFGNDFMDVRSTFRGNEVFSLQCRVVKEFLTGWAHRLSVVHAQLHY